MFFKAKSGGVSWLIVFLGNPGPKYENTRHNAGFMTADIIEKREGFKINRLRFSSLSAICSLGGEKALLIKPQTYMNLSGNSVSSAASFYKIPPERIIVICDDMALPVGKLRIRAKGSSGGHNGLKSIIACLGTESFPRVKIGIGSPETNAGEEEVINWVIGRFSRDELRLVSAACEAAADAVALIIESGIEKAMNSFN
ncbi:MAG: aminoacyl-tRNA hydrolase [Clostridiales bacterium]|nr:aminoacyl-tRNA hydrolase [Clostridiales bacterium]